jgi:CubicO group peptidase (beta-lactamase class C family)/predicted N-acetyltransferase YhbS
MPPGGRAVTGHAIPPPSLTAIYRGLPGRQADGYSAVSRLLLRGLADGAPPAAAMAVVSASGVCYRAAGGWANLGHGASTPVAASADTLFDLASLTKVIVTTPLVLLLHQRRAWDLDDPVSNWLPGSARSAVTIRHCLTHTAGLVWHRPYFASQSDARALKAAVLAELGAAVPGPVCYSDLSFMLLGWAVENCAREPLEVLARRELLAPLGMTRTRYRPDADLAGIAATEVNGDQRLHDVAIWGEVHDGNAFALGGISGHAGLFGTIDDLARFAAALLRPEDHPVLNADIIDLMTQRHTAAGGADVRALGWRLRPQGWGSWPRGTYWHTGFTGTSMLISPGADTAVVLLTNFVHPERRLEEADRLRTKVHRAVLRARPLAGTRVTSPADQEPGASGLDRGRPVGLRQARPADLSALAGIFVAAWRHGYPGIVPDSVIAAIDQAAAEDIIGKPGSRRESRTVVAEAGGIPGGYIQYGPDADAADDRTGYVAALYVHPGQAGRGIGRRLLDHAVAELSRTGRHRVRLWVFANNTRAQGLYASAGFRPDGAELTDPRWRTRQIRMQRDPRP